MVGLRNVSISLLRLDFLVPKFSAPTNSLFSTRATDTCRPSRQWWSAELNGLNKPRVPAVDLSGPDG
jgi:hypothetical protein